MHFNQPKCWQSQQYSYTLFVYVIRYSHSLSHSLFVTVGEIKNGKTLLVCCSAASLSLSLSAVPFQIGYYTELAAAPPATHKHTLTALRSVCVLTYVCARIFAYCLARHNAKMRVTSFLKPQHKQWDLHMCATVYM